jgi:DNA polymerase-3 subunit gamma/tau
VVDNVAYQVLSRKWRPQRFQDVVGQEHVTRSFQNAIIKNKLGHAYVLTGTRGIGKTSVARIFAKSLRCLNRLEDANPCGECQGCKEFGSGSSMNVLEIDGASNNSVDDIRELVNNVQTLPTFGSYKVYIIDEVHMLSTSAFNALLKTLEEPPSHTVFLLATTEPHKLLDTVLSRCIRFDFRNASVESLVGHIKNVSLKENITFENEKLIEVLATQGNGSFRDTLSLMDQVLSFSEDNKITEDTLSVALGLARVSSVRNLVEGIILGDSQRCSDSYLEMLQENVSVKNITTNILDSFFELINKIDQLAQLAFSPEVKAYIEKSTIDEFFWIFESMARDFSWALESQMPEKTINIIIQKHAKRSQILQGSGLSVTEIEPKKKVKNTDTANPEEAPESNWIEETLVEEKDSNVQEVQGTEELESESLKDEHAPIKSHLEEQFQASESALKPHGQDWSSFESFIKKEIPAIYAELEQGNIIDNLERSHDRVVIKYGFSEDSKLFYDHLITGEGKEKIESLMKDFFQVSVAELQLVYLDNKEAQEQSFLSKSEIREKQRILAIQEKEEGLRTHPIIQEAEKLFGKKIDKVKVNEE